MRNIIPPLTLLLATLPSGALRAQDKPWDLVGQVVSIEDGEDKPIKIARVTLTVREFLRDGKTDSRGLFVINLPGDAKPGQEVVFIHDRDLYEIFHPYRGALRLPAPGTPPPFVEVRMLPKGSKRWLTDTAIDVFIDNERSRSAKRPAGEAGGSFDFDASLRGLASYTGVSEEDTRTRLTGYINAFREGVADQHRQANAEFLARNYPRAGELYLEASKGLERAGVEHIRLGCYEREAAGDSFYNALDFAKALSIYQESEVSLAAYRTTRRALGLGDYPESGPDRRRLTLKAANARNELGRRIAGPQLTVHLNECIIFYRNLLAEITRTIEPQDWAVTQNNLGVALGDLAGRSAGAEAAGLLREAVAAHRLALEVYTRDQLPHDWAVTQHNLGIELQIYFATKEFRAGLEQFTRLMKEERHAAIPQFVVLVDVLRVLCHRGLGEVGQATEALDSLIAHVEHQPEPFRISWSFSKLRRVVEQSKVEAVAASQDFLLAVLDAASQKDRRAILEGLKRVRAK